MCTCVCERKSLKSNLPLRQVSEAGHAGQTAEDPGELSVLGHLQDREKGWGGETSNVTVRGKSSVIIILKTHTQTHIC